MGEAVTYEGGRKLQAGWVTTDQIPLGADTYYVGMELEYDAANDIYIALATDANVAAIYNGVDARVLAAPGVGDAIMAGEINESGLVDDAGDAKTLTEDQRATRRNRGFYTKRV